MAAQLKRLLSHPVFIVLFAFAARMAILAYMWEGTLTPVKIFHPLWV